MAPVATGDWREHNATATLKRASRFATEREKESSRQRHTLPVFVGGGSPLSAPHFSFTQRMMGVRRLLRPAVAMIGSGTVAAAAATAHCDVDHSSNVYVLKDTPLTRSLHTLMRDKTAPRAQFVIASNRLTHLLIEEAMALLPSMPVTVQTPCGPYQGMLLPAENTLCAVSILRAADCMLGEVRTMMPAVAVGKILIQRDEETAMPTLFYSKLPPDVAKRQVLLLDPMLATGGSAVKAIDCLVAKGVRPENIIFVNIVCVVEGLRAVHEAYPQIRIVTGGIDPILNEKKYIVPGLGDFGDRYFGTDGCD